MIHSFIHFISQNTSYIKTTSKINVLKVFHKTERPVALTTAHTDTNTKHKAKNTKQMSNANNEYC